MTPNKTLDTQNKYKVVFISNILPTKIVDELKLSVAGKKFELSILKELNEIVGNENLNIVSISFEGKNMNVREVDDFLWEGKRYKHIKRIKYPILTEIHLV